MEEKNWADIEADDDYEPQISSRLAGASVGGFETKPDQDGIKTLTTYMKNHKGETIKIIKRIKVTRKHQRINKEVYARRDMKKFGYENEEEFSDRGNSSFTTNAAEDVFIEIPKNSKIRLKMKESNDMDEYYFPDLTNMKATKDLKQKFKALKDDLKDMQESNRQDGEGDYNSDRKNGNNEGGRDREKERDRGDRDRADGRGGGEGETGKRYVIPRMRDGDKYRDYDQKQKEENTIRVTNLSEDVRDVDLFELFGVTGKISRIFLAKHKETKNSKGFAFITYYKQEDALRAVRQLNRHGYDNLLLNVELAKPSVREH